MSEWSTSQLGELAENISRPFKFSGKEKVIFINTGDVLEGKFLHNEYSLVKGLPGQAKKAIKKGDILYSEIRPGNKRYVFVGFDAEDYVVSTKFMVVKANDNILPEFLYLILTGRSCEQEFKIIAESRSGTFPQITFDSVSYYPVRYPEKTVQRRIVEIASSISKKIELNRQINQTLEKIAQAIFKSWFVNFEPVQAKIQAKQNGQDLERAAMRAISGKTDEQLDQLSPDQLQQLITTAALFSDELEESELGEIPRGWSVEEVGSYGKVITGKTPQKKIEGAYSSVGLSFITPTDIEDDVFVIHTNRFLTVAGVASVKKYCIPSGTICVTCIGSQMGKTIIASSDSYTNQQINSIIVDDDQVRNYLFLNLRGRRKEIFLIGSSGSTMPIINKSTFERLKVLTPRKDLVANFQNTTDSMFQTILANSEQSRTLIETRDSLLPKLVAGDLFVTQYQILA